ncbi:MAG: hypothetical protein LBI81_00710 [Puniceicoccales bacterium]|nr:hypothetical protein [Puniceicoccales bacterium]
MKLFIPVVLCEQCLSPMTLGKHFFPRDLRVRNHGINDAVGKSCDGAEDEI